jgi:cell division protease FtsH
LGGRAAETIVFNEFSTGAADDLAQATNIARTMVTRYGMDEALGQVTYDSERQTFLGQPQDFGLFPRSYSEQTAWQIDEAVRELINQAFDRATSILEAHRQLLDDTARKLLEKETLTADELPSLDEFHEISEADELHREVG